MPYCPNCRTEYLAGMTRCTDCGAALTDTLPADANQATGEALRPAQLCLLDDQVQLELIENQLRQAGIPSTRRARNIALFVPAGRLEEAQCALAGERAAPPLETVGLSELHRIRLACSQCEAEVKLDLLTERVPASCPACGHIFALGAVQPVLDRYADIMRMMADADFDIELELPREEG